MRNSSATKKIFTSFDQSQIAVGIVNKRDSTFCVQIEKALPKNSPILSEILLEEKELSRTHLNKEAFQRMVTSFISGKGDYFPGCDSIASLLKFKLWHKRYLN